jgi:trans-2,3-dihydro-3-hydroxyanthranilate isomerase
MDLSFALADVFTDVPYGGNRLAVFPDARGIRDATMRALAREFDFPESTFVMPPAKPGDPWGLRIFTPAEELPFAGHPTVGTAAVLARLGVLGLPASGGEIVFQEGIGPVHVRIGPPGPVTQTRFTITRAIERAPQEPSRADVAAALSLPAQAVLDLWSASVGVKFCFVHLREPADVDRAVLDRPAWLRVFGKAWCSEIFFFAGDTAPGARLYARMFAPAFGIGEDPATGSAVAALAGALVARTTGPVGTRAAWTVDQGVLMGRPSRIDASAAKADGGKLTIEIGGSTVLMGTGTMILP